MVPRSPTAAPEPVETAAAPTLVTAPQRRAWRRSGALWWIVRRLGAAVVILFCVSLLIFAATQGLPSDAARAILGPSATQEQLEFLREELGLNRPLVEQYTTWISGAVHGDFGDSLIQRRPVTDVLGPRLQNSAALVLLSALIGFSLSIFLGVVTAVRRDRPFDHAFVFGSLVLAAVPGFVFAIFLVMLFSTSVFHWFPAVALFPQGENPFAHFDVLVLPALALGINLVPYLGRLIRASMIDVLESEYVQMARLKGMPERIIMLRHALPNAIVPGIQGMALTLGYLTGGIVAIEFLFNYPGIGSGLADAIEFRDLPVIQASVLALALAYVVFNLIADIVTIYLTPRLRDALR